MGVVGVVTWLAERLWHCGAGRRSWRSGHPSSHIWAWSAWLVPPLSRPSLSLSVFSMFVLPQRYLIHRTTIHVDVVKHLPSMLTIV